MKAARIFGANDIRVVDIDPPEPGDGDILCRVFRAGICGTDYAIFTGEFSFVKNGMIKFPMTPGHEWSGIVEKTGKNVKNFKPGDRVVGDTGVSCGICYDCLMGNYNLCKKGRSVGTINCWDGAYAEFILMPERHLFHLPESISFDNGALIEPAATALYSVVLADVKIGDTVLVVGSGPIGIAAAKLAKLSGASKVAIAGRKDFKLEKAIGMGIDYAINTTKTSLEEGVRECFGEWGVERIIEASGSIEMLKKALDVLNQNGVISAVAFYEKTVEKFDIDRFVFGEIKLRGVAGSLGMYRPVMRLMETGMLDMSALITSRYKQSEIHLAMKDMKDKNETRIKQIIDYV